MALLSFEHVKIEGISACVPSHIEKNENYKILTEQERSQLIKTIGVSERRIADKNTTAADLCQQAAERLILELNWRKEEIGLLIFLSQSPDYYLPATSIVLQDKMGLPKNCMAFDMNLGCSGFIYSLSIASSLISSGNIKKALVLCGDKSSVSVPYSDKSTYPLFGDAGTATALSFNENSSPFQFNLKSDGDGYQNIIIYEGGCRNPVTKASLDVKEIEKGIQRNGLNLVLNGSNVFDFTLNDVLPTIKESLSISGNTTNDIDYFIFHQANLLMNETLRKLLKIPLEKTPYSLQNFGNTSSASIPLTIVSQINNEVRTKINKFLFCGFGVGLSWGTIILEMGNIVCPPLIEYNANENR